MRRLEAKTSKRLVKVVAISDTHGCHDYLDPLRQGDILIHAGDFTKRGTQEECEQMARWLGCQSHAHKLVTPGNHDAWVEREPVAAARLFDKFGVRLLLHETVVLEGFKFFGSPFTPAFNNWHFMQARGGKSERAWASIGLDTDVVITHGPPYGHGDLVDAYGGSPPRHAGCLALLERLRQVRPSYHLFGHIHEGYGVTVSDEIPGTTFANVSVVDSRYRLRNDPFYFQLA